MSGSEWEALEQRREQLFNERDALVAESEHMDPALAARALRVLADKFDELEAAYGALLRDRSQE